MSGPLPPVPDLIPIALLRAEVMGEQRSRRPGSQPELIDSAGSRGPTPPQSRKARHRRRSKHRAPSPTPRVNPIFVWVRQEDTRIVDVKCEDYDKRNRILLTKTAQGWRAIPRTETLVLKEAADGRHHRRKSRKNKVRRKSAAVQVDSVDQVPASPTWTSPVNVESHLPSHKIHVPKKCPSPLAEDSVNSASESAHAQTECSGAKMCEVSPLDNLLAVAEFEFNQHMQSGEWDKSPKEVDKEFNMDQLIESCDKGAEQPKAEDCDYTEDDDNNLAMDDILSRLEQSLQSPECPEIPDSNAEVKECFPAKPGEEVVESSTTDEPTDLSLKPKYDDNECNNQPTDLTVPKNSSPASTPRPPSQNSEAIQSPQPSGIPAVPPSPDIVSTSANTNKKSVFLESLLTTTSQKIALNSEVTIIKQKEPLDLGKCRKSASPTVTCSEEVKNASEDSEPPTKKFKSEDITLKNLLDIEMAKAEDKSADKTNVPETPRLLELLKTDSGPDPLTQLRQILCDTSLNVPDPMLVPKERLSQIISHPGREIPRLLKQRPELRLPEALAFPHLLQDPDILVITLQQLETIILKQNQSLNLKEIKSVEKSVEKPAKKTVDGHPKKKSLDESVTKLMSSAQETQPSKGFNELASDIDAATTAAFNQMLWLPYLNQLEAMSFGNNPEVMKMLSGPPVYPGPDLNHLRFPPPVNFPLQQPSYNSLELSMWQEAMMQANMLRPKMPFDTHKNSFRDYLDKLNFAKTPKPPIKPPPSNFYPSASNYQSSFLNVPNTFQKQNLQIPHYNPLFAQKHKSYKPAKPHLYYKQEQPKPKVACKPFANVAYKPPEFAKPIDLSGSTPPSKLKVKQHLIEPASKLLKHDDVPEVGSTTASVEEMQDAHKHLWHPLFGNQKGYHSPWNWTTVTATGE